MLTDNTYSRGHNKIGFHEWKFMLLGSCITFIDTTEFPLSWSNLTIIGIGGQTTPLLTKIQIIHLIHSYIFLLLCFYMDSNFSLLGSCICRLAHSLVLLRDDNIIKRSGQVVNIAGHSLSLASYMVLWYLPLTCAFIIMIESTMWWCSDVWKGSQIQHHTYWT